MIKKILAASDGSTAAIKAARTAAVIAKAFDAELTVVTAAYVPEMYKVDLSAEMENAYLEDWKHVLMDTVKAVGDSVNARSRLLQDGSPAEAILEEAERGGYDLVVVGSTGTGNPGERAMGSVAARVGARARCSVLVVR